MGMRRTDSVALKTDYRLTDYIPINKCIVASGRELHRENIKRI